MMRALGATLVICVAAAVSACAIAPAHSTDPGPLIAYLVRHAEKQTGRDPGLTEAGRKRAQALAAKLKDEGIEYIHSSNYRRTRDTAAPIAEMYGIEVQLYDPSDLPALAAMLREIGGRHLVVGHSNTTPQLAALLGGDPGPPIDEAHEYDRLYLIMLCYGETRSTVTRYGRHTTNAKN